MSEKKDYKLDLGKFFIPSRRGRLSIERILCRRNMWIVSILILTIIFFSIFFNAIINTLESIEDENFRLSTIIAIILGSQLLFILFQTINQINTNRYTRIQSLPRISVNAEVRRITNNRGRNVGKKLFLTLFNNGMDAHNVSYLIRIDKTDIKSKVPLFLLAQNKEKEIYKMSESEFKDKSIDILIELEDMTNFGREIKFRKDKNETEFRTIYTGFW